MRDSVLAFVALVAAPAAVDPGSEAIFPASIAKSPCTTRETRTRFLFHAPDPSCFPDKSLAKEAVRKRFEARIAEPSLHATLVSRLVIGDEVIGCASIVRTFPEVPGICEGNRRRTSFV